MESAPKALLSSILIQGAQAMTFTLQEDIGIINTILSVMSFSEQDESGNKKLSFGALCIDGGLLHGGARAGGARGAA